MIVSRTHPEVANLSARMLYETIVRGALAAASGAPTARNCRAAAIAEESMRTAKKRRRASLLTTAWCSPQRSDELIKRRYFFAGSFPSVPAWEWINFTGDGCGGV